MASLGSEWHLSPEGLKTVSQNDSTTLLRAALDSDLKEVGLAFLNNELSKGRTSKIVLQIQKIRNVAAPKANEGSQAAPRMLKLVLTDGVTYVQAIETSVIPSISRDKTPPGTKLLLNGAKVVSGYLLINVNNCILLGGKVPHLVDKWELAKSVQTHNRQSSTEGAPAWVNFGCKIQSSQDQQFKSLENKAKDASKENCEFEQLRKDAIAEAATGAVRKVFGGGGIVRQPTENNRRFNNTDNSNRDRNNRQSKSKNVVKIEEEKSQKPSEKVSLFDFLEDKLQVKEAINDNASSNFTNNSSRSNNISQVTQQSNGRQNNYYNKSKYTVNTNSQPNDYNKKAEPRTENRNSDYVPELKQLRNRTQQFPRNNYNNNYNQDDRHRMSQPDQQVKNRTQPPRNNNYNNYSHDDKSKSSQVDPRSNKSNDNFEQQNQKNNVDRIASDVSKISLNSEFASRSLRQHLNLVPANRKPNVESFTPRNHVNNPSSLWRWNAGDPCLAKYWEDGKYYDATVTAVTDKTCVVRFNGYGNIEEVLRADCLPITDNHQENSIRGVDSFGQQQYNTGPVEYRRNTKTYSRRQ